MPCAGTAARAQPAVSLSRGVKGAVFKAEVVDDTQLRGLSAEGELYWGDVSPDGGLRLSTTGDARASETIFAGASGRYGN